jgi:hypothetical protein
VTRWPIRAAVLVLLAGTLVHHLYGYAHEDLSGHAAGSDDAYISYRYARSLAEGDGLVFNPGERVEGYSNLLHVLLLAPAFLLVRDSGIHPLAVALNAVFACAALVLFHGRLRERHGARVAGWAALALAASPALWLWNASGMETALVLLLQVALWAEVTGGPARPSERLAVILVLLIFARADGFVGAGLAVAYLAVTRDRRTRAAGLALAGAMAALTAWRLAYYGWPLPNTYYAKVAGPLAERTTGALRQLADLALLGLLPVLVVLAAAGAAALAKRRPAFEPFFALGWLAYWIYVGGDVFGERFLLVLLPLALAVLASAAADRRTLAAAGLVAVVLFQLGPLAADRRFRYAGPKHDRWVALGRALAAPEHRGKTIAVDAAGKIPYYSRLRTIDMLGLADAHIAHRPAATFRVGHSKHDADYVLARGPELIATWIDPGLDLRWGLPRARYEAAGYRLRWLASVRRFPPADPGAIVDARALDPTAASDLVRRGWQYAVVEKASAPPSPAPPPPADAVPPRPPGSPARRGSRGPRRGPRRRRPAFRG